MAFQLNVFGPESQGGRLLLERTLELEPSGPGRGRSPSPAPSARSG